MFKPFKTGYSWISYRSQNRSKSVEIGFDQYGASLGLSKNEDYKDGLILLRRIEMRPRWKALILAS
jgi:hypothetical protein